MRRRQLCNIAVTVTMAVASAVTPVLGQVSPASGDTAIAHCASSALRVSATTDAWGQGWLADTLFLGWLTLKNTARYTCELKGDDFTIRAEVGEGRRRTPAGAASRVRPSGTLLLEPAQAVTMSVTVTGRLPSKPESRSCSAPFFVGLLVSGPASWWPQRFVSITPGHPACGMSRLSVRTGVLSRA